MAKRARRNPQDATLRNVQAAARRDRQNAEVLRCVELRVRALERGQRETHALLRRLAQALRTRARA